MKKIKVEYFDVCGGVCNGTLKITVDGVVLYEKEGCLQIFITEFTSISTGIAGVDSELNDYVEEGELIWRDAENFPKDIQKAVRKELAKHGVCCGMCV